MIITKLIGGLGNQMFQYAAGTSLALKHETIIKIDDSFLKKPVQGIDTKRDFELDIFELAPSIATSREIDPFFRRRDNKIYRELHRRFPSFFNYLKVDERGSNYHVEFEKFPSNTYLNGYWQSELYFIKYADQIRKIFQFKQEIVERNSIQTAKINTSINSVSIHVRRGDYVSNPEANKFHGLCSMDYYMAAVEYIKSKLSDPVFYVFSDDLDWCKSNFNFDLSFNFVKSDSAHSDLFLMTKCSHNIIANSSFSWWAAWLNSNENKITIAPKKWFANNKVSSQDLIPESWVKL